MDSSKVTVTKKACDGCKIRKIRCGGGHPCRPCTNARIQCTYLRTQQLRGPQKLRAATIRLIEQNQRENNHNADGARSSLRLPANAIASLLYIYHVRMYPVWPVVHVDRLIARLHEDTTGNDYETRALATAVAAATMAQLGLGTDTTNGDSISANTLATECLDARRLLNYRSVVSLNAICTSFFLHAFYENQEPGGSESILYLREAITFAQIMHLHREASYTDLPAHEQQIRRRVLWLLFITERTDIKMPEVETDDEPQILSAFVKLLGLFQLFEESRLFDIVRDYHLGLQPPNPLTTTTEMTIYNILHDKFRGVPGASGEISDIQRADLCVTRQWMRILTWKAVFRARMRQMANSRSPITPTYPLLVARELVDKAHGLGMRLKLHEIADSLADAVTNAAMLPNAPTWDHSCHPSTVLARLHSLLSALRDGEDNTLVDLLYQKMEYAHSLSTSPDIRTLGSLHVTEVRGCQVQMASGVLNNEAASQNPFRVEDAGSTGDGTNPSQPTSSPRPILLHTDEAVERPFSYIRSTGDSSIGIAFDDIIASVSAVEAPFEFSTFDSVTNSIILDTPIDRLA
ncbi:hypothetical protein BJX61DRAFT_534137 [Aspergillus egyptiacus]|nr:hypothetical protein BJX61DRAFT_534137 [Aspergillus egyptiacus]